MEIAFYVSREMFCAKKVSFRFWSKIFSVFGSSVSGRVVKATFYVSKRTFELKKLETKLSREKFCQGCQTAVTSPVWRYISENSTNRTLFTANWKFPLGMFFQLRVCFSFVFFYNQKRKGEKKVISIILLNDILQKTKLLKDLDGKKQSRLFSLKISCRKRKKSGFFAFLCSFCTTLF